MEHISLARALATGRLDEFVQQEEARGVGPIDPAAFDTVASAVIVPLPSNQTSRSRDGDCSDEK